MHKDSQSQEANSVVEAFFAQAQQGGFKGTIEAFKSQFGCMFACKAMCKNGQRKQEALKDYGVDLTGQQIVDDAGQTIIPKVA